MSPLTPAPSHPLVVAALPEEVEPLRRSLEGLRSQRLSRRLTLTWGRFAGRPLAVASTGDGAADAEAGIRALFTAFPVERLLVVGIAGGLSPELAPGHLLLARQVLSWSPESPDPSRTEPAPEDLAAGRAAGAAEGAAATVSRLVSTAAEKSDLYRRMAFDGPATVDLESAVFVAHARSQRVPWLVLRAVSDAAHEPLPEVLSACQDERGRVVRSRVVRYALARPGALPDLLALRRRLVRGAWSLERGARAILEAWGGVP